MLIMAVAIKSKKLMGTLSNLSYSENIEHEKDVLGGTFSIFDSDIYAAQIKLAYISKSESGATGINFVFAIDDREYKEPLWVTNKSGENFYTKDGEKHYLQGFLIADSIALLAAKKPLASLDTEVKKIKVFNYELKEDVLIDAEVITALIGQTVKLALIHRKVFKREKVGNEYKDTDEVRDENAINKVFRAADNFTTHEIRASAKEPNFYTKWLEKWKGQVQDRTTKKDGTIKPSAPKMGTSAASDVKPTADSLFG